MVEQYIDTINVGGTDYEIGCNCGKPVYSDDTGDYGFVYRLTAEGEGLHKENATIKKFVGNSLVWNQLIYTSYRNYTNDVTDNRSNVSLMLQFFNGNTPVQSTDINSEIGIKSFIVTVPNEAVSALKLKHNGATQDLNIYRSNAPNFTKGHKLFWKFDLIGNDIYTVGGFKTENLICIDLTLMFGSGKEPSTVAEFEKLLTEPYYAYNAGTLINNRTKAIETVGFNLLDETKITKVGMYTWATGAYYNNPEFKCTEEYFTCLPNTSYYKRVGLGMYWYDINKNFISSNTDSTGIVTSPTNAHFFRVCARVENIGIGVLCLNISDSTRNGTYEPYKKSILPINLNSFRVKDSNGNVLTIEGGLKSAGNVYDEITSDGKYIKRVGSVDLGSLPASIWDKAVNDYWYQRRHITNDITNMAQTNNLCCNLLATAKNLHELQTDHAKDKLILWSGGDYLVIRNLACSTNTELKTWLEDNNAVMYYELSTPEVYELVDVIPNNYPVDDLGTEARIAPLDNSGVPGSPFKGDIDYYRSSDSYLHNVTINDLPTYVHDGVAEIDIPLNSSTKDGLVKSGENQANKVWKTDASGNPDWRAESVVPDGTYPDMTVGKSLTIVGDDVENTDTYVLRSTAGNTSGVDNEIESGYAQISKIEGNGLAWNQLINTTNKDFTSTNTDTASTLYLRVSIYDGSTMSAYISSTYISQPGQVSCLFTANASGYLYPKHYGSTRDIVIWNSTNNVKVIQGHKYYFTGNFTGVDVSTVGGVSIENMQLIDLSLIYGLGNEPTSVADVEADLAKLIAQKPYYQENAGELYGVKKLHIVSYGQNLLNPSTRTARLATYSYGDNSNKYGIQAKEGATIDTITFTPDATGVAETITPDSNGIFTIPSAGTLSVTMTTGTANDVYVWAVWDGKKDGINNYKPYATDALEIDTTQIYGKLNGSGNMTQVFPDGMKATGITDSAVRDFVDVAGKEAKVNVGNVDLGSLSWNYPNAAYFESSDIVGKYRPAICQKYAYTQIVHINTASGYVGMNGGRDGGHVRIKDTSYSDAATLKTAMSGVYLWYELVTPLTYTDLKISTDSGTTFQDLPEYIAVDNWGIEELYPSDTPASGKDFTGVAAQVTAIYQKNVSESIESMPDEYASISTLKGKADRVPNSTAGNIAVMTGDGNYADSGVTINSIKDFGASGSSHSSGLVPDPGSTAGTSKYLCEDGSWKLVSTTDTTYKLTVNGTVNGDLSGTSLGTIYTPTSYGTTGLFLKSNGDNNAPTWDIPTDTTYSAGSNISITGNNNAINALGYTWNSNSSVFAVTGQVNASVGFFQTSDIRKKEIVGDLDLNKAYDLIDKCQTIIYTLKDNDQKQIGLIAQEVKEFFPEIVSEDENGYLSLDYSRLTVVILKVLKDLINRVSKLENYGNNN